MHKGKPMRTAINLWHNPINSDSKPVLSYEGRCLLSYRGVEIYKNPAGSWDYLLSDCAIAQRGGFDAERSKAMIDEMLAGQCPLLSKEVKAHIAQHMKSIPATA
jgi:hypothetical protein